MCGRTDVSRRRFLRIHCCAKYTPVKRYTAVPTNFLKFPQPPRHCLTHLATPPRHAAPHRAPRASSPPRTRPDGRHCISGTSHFTSGTLYFGDCGELLAGLGVVHRAPYSCPPEFSGLGADPRRPGVSIDLRLIPGVVDIRSRRDFSRFDPRPGRPHFSNFGPPAERRPFCRKVFGHGEKARFSRFGRPRGAVGQFSRWRSPPMKRAPPLASCRREARRTSSGWSSASGRSASTSQRTYR
eukprot:scaffold10372_cov67-Phaeocystis_antarctica.AAC.3